MFKHLDILTWNIQSGFKEVEPKDAFSNLEAAILREGTKRFDGTPPPASVYTLRINYDCTPV